MAGEHDAAGDIRPDGGEQVGLLAVRVECQPAVDAEFLEIVTGVVDQRQIGVADTVSNPIKKLGVIEALNGLSGPQVRQLRGRGAADDGEKLAPSRGIGAKAAEHAARHHTHSRLVHAARGHALVCGVDNDANPAWLQHLLDRVGDLGGQLLLYLQAAGIGLRARAPAC
jgi:hypothetical protein